MPSRLRQLLSNAADLAKPGGLERLRRKVEDRVMDAILDATRVTNDGSYRRYRDDPTKRGEHTPPSSSDPAVDEDPSPPGDPTSSH